MKPIKVSSYPLHPLVRPIAEDMVYEVIRSINYIVNGTRIDVPEGFTTDGASIPRLFWFTTGTPFSPHYLRGAIIHDYIYQTGKTSRKYADQVIYSYLLQDGTSKYNATKIYYALRLAGMFTWRRYRWMERENRKREGWHISNQDRISMRPIVKGK